MLKVVLSFLIILIITIIREKINKNNSKKDKFHLILRFIFYSILYYVLFNFLFLRLDLKFLYNMSK